MPTNFKLILVPVDGSDASMRAVDLGVQLAEALDAALEVVTVLDLGQLDFYDGMYMSLEQIESWQERVRNDILEAAMARVPDDGLKASFELVRGPVIKSLLAHIDKVKPSMVVLGRTGKGALREAIAGSVSSPLVHHLHVPVTVIS